MDSGLLIGIVGVAGTVLGAAVQAGLPLIDSKRKERERTADRAEKWLDQRRNSALDFVRLTDDVHETGRAYVEALSDEESEVTSLTAARSAYLGAWKDLATGLGPVQLQNTESVSDAARSLYNAATEYSSAVDRRARSTRWSGQAAEDKLIESRREFVNLARLELTPANV